jgi:hypothetical protein
MILNRQIFNNIRRYTHTHSPSNKIQKLDNTSLETKIDKISSDLYQIRVLVMSNYFITVLPGFIWLFK